MRFRTSRARWLLHRFALAASVVVGVATLTFVMIHAAPGDPIYALAGDGGSPAYYADMRAKYGVDRPIVEQFGRYARAVAVGDFGYSFMYQAPVARVLVQHAPGVPPSRRYLTYASCVFSLPPSVTLTACLSLTAPLFTRLMSR